jgi:2OG-Fe(II) oxygenase superfamily
MVKVFDNILPAYEFKKLHEEIMQFDFPWNFGRKSKDEEVDNPFRYAFVRVVMLDGALLYDPHGIIERAVRLALKYAGEDVICIHRIRCILNTVADKNYDFGAHIDETHPNRVAIIYLNDSDGDTTVYNEKFNPSIITIDGRHTIDDKTVPDLTVKETIAPKANRMVIFDGEHYHSGNTPTTVPRRVAINIVYSTMEENKPRHIPTPTLTSY